MWTPLAVEACRVSAVCLRVVTTSSSPEGGIGVFGTEHLLNGDRDGRDLMRLLLVRVVALLLVGLVGVRSGEGMQTRGALDGGPESSFLAHHYAHRGLHVRHLLNVRVDAGYPIFHVAQVPRLLQVLLLDVAFFVGDFFFD